MEIDRAMRWGYANTLGPFELWDALGFSDTVHRIESEGRALPQSIERMCAAGATSFYQAADVQTAVSRATTLFRPDGRRALLRPRAASRHHRLIGRPEAQSARQVVTQERRRQSLVDLGDGVLCVEFHS